jgi:hypothetical protein
VDTNYARWHPGLPQPDDYRVSVFVPPTHSGGTGIYRLSTRYGPVQVPLDQSLFAGGWAELGVFPLSPGDSLCLGDGGTTPGEQLAFDAALFVRASGGIAPGQGSPAPMSAAPNPCAGAIRIVFPVPPGEGSRLLLLDVAGRVLDSVPLEEGATESMIGSGLPGGIYIVRCMPSGETVRAVVLR